MKKLVASLVIAFALGLTVSAATQALLTGIKGKVEIKSANGTWIAATEGMKIDIKTTISTGFDSTASISIDQSTIVVKPLTRLTLDKLIEQSAGSVSASMFLRVGAVQASVKAAVPGVPQDFKVQSPYSTASVRGTEFLFDGLYLRVINGVVVLVPGRPVRDAQPTEGASGGQEGEAAGGGEGAGEGETSGGDESGFAGATNIDPVNPANGVAVSEGQQAALQVFFSLDTGSRPVQGGDVSGNLGGQGETAPPPSAPPPTSRSGVVITVTGP